MHKGRMEAFTDGVAAVITTTMVLELKATHGAGWNALAADLPVFPSYVLSFVYVGIYWNNHHHTLQMVTQVGGRALWANLFMLFWISLLPFATRWLNEAHPIPSPVPAAVHGIVLMLAALSWIPLVRTLITANGGGQCALAWALQRDWKQIISPPAYLASIVLAFFAPILLRVSHATVAALWLIPGRRLEIELRT